MRYAREYKKIVRRIVESAELEIAWKDLEKIYGTKATRQLKELAPADPLLLHDLMVISNLNDGKTRKEVEELLLSYTKKDWTYDMQNFAKTIKKVKELHFKRIKERKE